MKGGPPMKKMKPTPSVVGKLSTIIKFLKDEESCPIEGPESGRQMLIKMAPFVLGKGAAVDQRGEHQIKALEDLEAVLNSALKHWADTVKMDEDAVHGAEQEKIEAQGAIDNA